VKPVYWAAFLIVDLAMWAAIILTIRAAL